MGNILALVVCVLLTEKRVISNVAPKSLLSSHIGQSLGLQAHPRRRARGAKDDTIDVCRGINYLLAGENMGYTRTMRLINYHDRFRPFKRNFLLFIYGTCAVWLASTREMRRRRRHRGASEF